MDSVPGAVGRSAAMARDDHRPQPPAVDEASTSAGELAARFLDRLRIFAARRLHDPAAAEDVAQETLARVVEALDAGRLEEPGALPGFVFQTARHVCLHQRRQLGRQRRAFERLGREPPPSLGAAIVQGLVARERQAEVRSALQGLEAADRELLLLFYYRDLSTGEIARRLSLEPGAVRVRKHRALRRLEAKLRSTSAEGDAS